MRSAWEVIKKGSSGTAAVLRTWSSLILALATLYLAYSAERSADSARETAEVARDTAAATRAIADTVSRIADAAGESVASIRTQLELSQRPLVTLGGNNWEVQQTGNVMSIRGELRDAVGVPTVMRRVCAWSSVQQVLDNQRTYVRIRLEDVDEVLVFRDLYRWFYYPPIQVTTPVEGRPIGFLGVVYTIAREGASVSETWRVESAIVIGSESRIQVRTTDMYRVDGPPC